MQTRIYIATRYLIEEASYLMLSLVLPCFYYSLHNKNLKLIRNQVKSFFGKEWITAWCRNSSTCIRNITTTKKYKEIGVLFHEYMSVLIQTFLHYSYTHDFRNFGTIIFSFVVSLTLTSFDKTLATIFSHLHFKQNPSR